MNLHGLVSAAVGAINPQLEATLAASTGYTTDAAGKRTPSYDTPTCVRVQLQPMTYRDLVQIEGLNINGEKAAVYMTGECAAVLRPDGKGGDLLTLPDDSKWLTVQVLENFFRTSGWVKCAIVRQLA